MIEDLTIILPSVEVHMTVKRKVEDEDVVPAFDLFCGVGTGASRGRSKIGEESQQGHINENQPSPSPKVSDQSSKSGCKRTVNLGLPFFYDCILLRERLPKFPRMLLVELFEMLPPFLDLLTNPFTLTTFTLTSALKTTPRGIEHLPDGFP
jgi:hypothetical protein